jgi:hypothetical protein
MNSVSYSGAVRTALSVAVLSALVACGGGGSDSPSASTVTVSGVAAKGLLKKAVVKAYSIDANGNKTLLKESVTDTTGTYSLAGIPAGVTVMVEITAGADTTMVDEATNQEVPAPAGFKIRAATVTQEGGTNTLQVTPFSEMAVVKYLADENPNLTQAQKIEGANEDIRTYLGYDVLTEKPEFSTDGTEPTNKSALMLAAVSQLANDDTKATALGCDTSASTGDRVKCVIEKMAEKGTSDSDLASDFEAAKLDTVDNEDYAGDDVPAAPQPQPVEIVAPTARDGVAAAKALIASLRNNAPLLGGSSDGDTLDKRLRAVQAAFDAAVNPLNHSQRALLQGVVEAADALDSATSKTGSFTASWDLNVNAMAGGCTYYSDAYVTDATSYDNVTHVGCRVTHAVMMENSTPYAYQTQFRVAHGSSAGSYTVDSRILKQEIDVNGNKVGLPTVLLAFQSTPAALTLTRNNSTGKLQGMTLLGKLAPNVKRDGTLTAAKATDVDVAITTSMANGDVNPTTLGLKGIFSSLDVNGAVLSTISLKEGSYVRAKLVTPGDPSSGLLDSTQTAVRFDLEASLSGGQKVSGVLTMSDLVPDKSGVGNELPGSTSFTGVITGSGNVQLFSGTLAVALSNIANYDTTLPDAADNFLHKTVTLDGSLYVPTAQAMVIHLAINEATTFQTYGVTGSYTQGELTVNVSGSGVQGNDSLSSVTFSSASGVSVTFTPAVDSFALTKGGVTIGQVVPHDGVINYVDNSHETF